MTMTNRAVEAAPKGGFLVEDGVEWYRIDDYDLLDPFLVSVVSPTDQWMYVSSSGALTAGRESAQHALFPYETDDRLHRAAGLSGPLTLFRIGEEIWEPFAAHTPLGQVRRSVAKSSEGDRLRFEEHHPGHGLTFRYTWAATDRFGFVRSCELVRDEGRGPVDVEILDGLVDVLPAGVELSSQQTSSTLVDAYRRAELYEPAQIAVFSLEALVSDRAEPAESLRSNVVWSRGLDEATVMLSDDQVRRFRSGVSLDVEHLVKGRKAGFLVVSSQHVDGPVRWMTVADVERTHADLVRLRSWLEESVDPQVEVASAVDQARADLVGIVARADALQETADRRATVHHFANVLFNVMRGGVFMNGHDVAVRDVEAFVAGRDATAVGSFREAIEGLDPVVAIWDLRAAVRDDPQLSRLVAEYLPLSFSRRHGDPSRPWNTFKISVWNDDGELGTGYEGNWRDIFQNWDALLHSFPEYLESVVAKFLNASTVDGFNPYRITDHGIDWEMAEEGAWANFGYWGDHQIAYLLRLLDDMCRFHPGALEADLDRVWLSYGDVPYRLVSYEDIVADPKATLVFDHDRQAAIEARVAEQGADGRLVTGPDGVHLASLGEKLLVPALSKLSNFVAGGGIWMNTQRPEWNDANNALVGNGVSVVTLFYLSDYLALVDRLLAATHVERVPMGRAVIGWIDHVRQAFAAHASIAISDDIDPKDRRSLLDALGSAFEDYRAVAYDAGPGPSQLIDVSALSAFLGEVRPFLDQAVRMAQRNDGLVEAYCLLRLEPDSARLDSLYEMLEGQVAALSVGDVGSEEAVRLVDTMYDSPLYREDQHSFILYPDRSLPPFWDKNILPEPGPTAQRILEAGSSILERDDDGRVHFASDLRSTRQLSAALSEYERGGASLTDEERAEILDLYETVFHHAAFTGRSGTMYRYEGLGSIYWHMVSKLLLAIQEQIFRALDAGEPAQVTRTLAERYARVRAGLGFMKDVTEQGTFPTDPHSHTPGHTGAQQPGMTGQVKEGVLLRWGELGLKVEDGCLRFVPAVLSPDEFLAEPRAWGPLGDGILESGTLGFTYCGVPFVYHLTDGEAWARVQWADGAETVATDRLDRDTSIALFRRQGHIDRIDVGVARSGLLLG